MFWWVEKFLKKIVTALPLISLVMLQTTPKKKNYCEAILTNLSLTKIIKTPCCLPFQTNSKCYLGWKLHSCSPSISQKKGTWRTTEYYFFEESGVKFTCSLKLDWHKKLYFSNANLSRLDFILSIQQSLSYVIINQWHSSS